MIIQKFLKLFYITMEYENKKNNHFCFLFDSTTLTVTIDNDKHTTRLIDVITIMLNGNND